MTITDEGASSVLVKGEGSALDSPIEVDRGRGRLLWLGLALLVLAIILGAGWWWRSHPTVFGEPANQFTARHQPTTPIFVSMVGPFRPDQLPQVSLIEATARTQVFGEAQVEVLGCHGELIGVGGGAAYDDLCFAVGTTQESEPGSWDQVVIKVTPESAGTIVVVEGIDLTYSTGLQRGTEFTGTPGVIVFRDDEG